VVNVGKNGKKPLPKMPSITWVMNVLIKSIPSDRGSLFVGSLTILSSSGELAILVDRRDGVANRQFSQLFLVNSAYAASYP
jgi:hypothetical protein